MFSKLECIIIDDDLKDLNRFEAAAIATEELIIVEKYTSLGPAMRYLRGRKTRIPFVFCDVELIGVNALVAGPDIKIYCKLLIYVTAHIHHKTVVLDVMGDDCLIKPVSSTQIQMRAIDRFFRRYEDQMTLEVRLNILYMYNSSKKTYDQIKLQDILLIVHESDYLDIYDVVGNKYTVRDTVGRAISLLEPVGIFIKINPGCIVNMYHVVDFDEGQVYFAKNRGLEKTSYQLTQSCKSNFMAYIKRHQIGKGGGLH